MALGTSNRDGGRTSESGHLRSIYKAFGAGVFSGLTVTQRAAGVNMSVDVAIGDGVIGRSDGTYGHPVFNDAVYNQVITAADASNPRRDIIVIYVDYGVTPSTGVSNNTNGVVAIKVVTGTPAGSPADPSDVAIQASVGSGNPFLKLARVRVGAGVTTISNSVIDDLRASILPAVQGTQDTVMNENTFDHVASGCIWTADAAGSTRLASMTAGVVYIGGKRLTVASVTGRTFTASKDVYVGLIDAGNGTATVVYYDNTTNAASPSLATAGYTMLLAIIVVGASSIATAASVNQGQEDRVLPIASSVPYCVQDSLGNLINPRDSQRRLLGYRPCTVSFTTASGTAVQITGLVCPAIIPTGRKVKVSVWSNQVKNSSNTAVVTITTGSVGGTVVGRAVAATGGYTCSIESILTLAAGLTTFYAGAYQAGGGTTTFEGNTTYPAHIRVELL